MKTAGKYLVGSAAGFGASSAGSRLVTVRINGGTTYAASQEFPSKSAADGTEVSASAVYSFSTGDYIDGRAYQTSGASLAYAIVAKRVPALFATWLCN